MAALGDAFAYVHAFCARNAIATEDALRLKLVVEELFTNTVRHGYGIEGDAPIRIALEATQDEIAVIYEDEAVPFDPTDRDFAPGSKQASADSSRRVGGLGLRLLGQLVKDGRYVREEGCNRLWLRLQRIPRR
jgi:serine/threonine-protein kinase RsbW